MTFLTNKGLIIGLLLVAAGCRSYYRATPPQAALLAVKDTTTSQNAAARGMAAFLKPYQDSLHAGMDVVLAQSAEEIGKGRPESKLGNLLTDMMLASARSQVSGGVDAAHLNLGGIRTVLKKGNVTLGDVYEIMPFDNRMVVASLKGAAMLDFLKWMARRQDPQSGMELVVSGDSLVSARIGGQPFDAGRTYRVAMSDYIFNGGDGAAFFKNSEAPVIKLPLYIRDVLVKAFKTTGPGPIQVTLDGRTKVVSN